VSKEVTAAICCALALAAGAWFTEGRQASVAGYVGASAPAGGPGAFAGTVAGARGDTADVAHRTAHGARRVAGVGDPIEPGVSTLRSGTVARVRRGKTVALRDGPGGRTLEVLDDTTPFGSRATFAVVRREGEWLGVLSNVLRNGDVGWIRADPGALAIERHDFRIVVDRSERRLTLLRRGRAAMSVTVGVGRAGSETPLGTFAVTDRLANTRWSGAYGCCIVALSGRQTRLPPGWRGGDRLAIHGTGGRGAAAAASAGCVAVDDAPLGRLMRTVPLGTLVTVRA
jgi:hypothetical protein